MDEARLSRVAHGAAHRCDAHAYQYGDDVAHFGRWPYPPAPRDDRDLPHNYLIVANRPSI